MSYTNIKRLMASALLLAFMSPSVLAVSESEINLPYKSTTTLSGDVFLTSDNNTITLSLRDSDVKQVLRMFADKAGMNIIFHSSVTGNVTLDLVDMPINEAFKLILQVSALNYYKQGGTMIILSSAHADNALYSKQEMMVFPVKYVSAAKIATFLNKNVFTMKKPGLSGVEAATVNAGTNELIIFGMPSDIGIVKKVIEQLDREPLTRTFTVNHTTPAEMANMICNVLVPARGISSGSSGGGGGATGGAAGVMTGAAMGAGGGGGSSSGGSGGSSSSGAIKVGEGVVACTLNTGSEGTLAHFDIQSLAISYYPQRGTITMMGGSEAQAEMIEKFIKENDIKQPQAYLEMSIVELSESGQKDFQNSWTLANDKWQFSFDGDGNTQAGRFSGPWGNWVDAVEYHYEPGGIQHIYDADTNMWIPTWVSAVFEETPIKMLMPSTTYVYWTMNYLIKNGKARVLANPKILITNGQQSTIDLTEDYVEKVTSEFLTSSLTAYGSTGAVQRTYTIGKDKGIKVELTPFISPEGYVTLNITPEYATEAGTVTAVGATGALEQVATLLSRRNLDLKNVRIKDGETLVIGGLVQESETKTVAKIPFLGDLPVIGTIFRSTATKRAKSELVLMITPKIIDDSEEKVADTL